MNIDVRIDTGMPPLILAIANGLEDTARSLIERKSDINAAGYDGITPLMAAALQGLGQISTMFLELNADIDAEFGTNNITPLTFPENYGHHHNVIVASFEAILSELESLSCHQETRET